MCITPQLAEQVAPRPAPAFAGRRAVVTGAARGIGLAVAERFGLLGAQLVLIDQDGSTLERARDRLAARGMDAVTRVLDVRNARAVRAAAAALDDDVGPADLLINNAGVLLRGRVDDEDAVEAWHRTLDVNLSGSFHMVHAFLPQLRRTRGSIVNIASIHALVAVSNSAAYTASKGGIKQLTQALALELGPAGIRVNAVAPGLTHTDMTAGLRRDPAALDAFMQRIPLRRCAQPEDIADAVQFLASDMASCITGVTLPVDGGYCAN